MRRGCSAATVFPVMILTAKSFLDECGGRVPTEPQIREALSGTLCRCTGLPEDRRCGRLGGAANERIVGAGERGVMSTYQHRVAGKRLKSHRRCRQGHRNAYLCCRFRAARHAFRQGPSQHDVARAHRAPRCDEGARIAWGHTVLTARDVPQIRFGTAVKDRTMFADGEVGSWARRSQRWPRPVSKLRKRRST